MDLETKLAEFALAAQPIDAARRMMRLSLLDWSACALAGTGETVSRIVRQMALGEGGAEQATLLGANAKIPARAAALANGVASHALDYDDTHFAHIGHPSVVVIPAALAMAELTGAKGPAFLDAALIGAEASIRVGTWLGRSHYQAGFHQTATAGIFGATLSAARLLGLQSAQARHALGIASTRAAGLKSQFGTMGKPYHAGLAAAGGVEAAQLAAGGFQSDQTGLSGPTGFGATHAGAADNRAWIGLGKSWMFQDISHKYHACCHGLHAMLEALSGLSDDVDASCVERLTITAHPRWKSVCNQADPATGLGVKFSFRHTAAMGLAGVDTAVLDSFSDAVAEDANLCALREKVNVVFDPKVAETGAAIVLHLTGGTVVQADHDLNAPLALDQRQIKLLSKARGLIGGQRTNALWAAIDPIVDLQAFRALLMQPLNTPS